MSSYEQSLSDSLNDSIEDNPKESRQTDLNSLDAEFNTNFYQEPQTNKKFFTKEQNEESEENESLEDSCRKIVDYPCQTQINKENINEEQQNHKSIQNFWSQTSFKLTYSSEKKSEEQTKKLNQLNPLQSQVRYLTFGQSSNKNLAFNQSQKLLAENQQSQQDFQIEDEFRIALQEIRKKSYNAALLTLKKIESKIEYSTNFGNFIYLTYLYSCVFFELQNYNEFLEYAMQMLNFCDQDEDQKIKNINYVLHTYQMIVDALLNNYNDPKEAIEHLKKAIQLAEQYSSTIQQPQFSANSLNLQLAQIYYNQNLIVEAYLLFQKFAPSNLNALYQCAIISYQQELFEDCIKYSNIIIEKEKDQKKLELIYNNLSHIYLEQNQNSEAINCLENALRINVEFYGLKNNQTCGCVMNLGKLYTKERQFVKANEKFNMALQIISQISGSCNQIYAKVLILIGENYFSMKNYKVCISQQFIYQMCINQYQTTFSIYKELFGLNHEFTWRVILNIIHLQLKTDDDWSENVKLLVESCVSSNNHLSGIIMNELANLMVKYQMNEYAQEIYLTSLEILNQQDPLQLPSIIQINLNLAQCYSQIQDYQKSIQTYKFAQKLELQRNEGQLSSLIGEMDKKIGQIFFKAKRIQESTFYYQNAIKTFKQFKDCKNQLESTIREFKQLNKA